ncbi:MAG: uroporphyrinogen-III C-methyltransferase [Alphaproteobacteria bacterium]|nr:uroporphyrinogen-III C-methyltransferase [Alphaproteobacteria bacterium]
MIDSKALRLPAMRPGTVWLVGAGPGDPGLLSVLALHALQSADVVVYDALVDRRILALARNAALEDAGKRGGRPSPRQPDISARLVALARDKRRVLRLKGGDPCVFGRGGEEALALAEAGVAFRIVPGITAAIGGLAYAGIPLTHRGINSAVTLITGHNSDGAVPGEEDSAPDWPAIAAGSPVIVLYMALTHLDDITRRLIAAGRAPDEPVAIVSRATTAAQQVVLTSLAEAASAGKTVQSPAIIAIGEIARLHRRLDWFARA